MKQLQLQQRQSKDYYPVFIHFYQNFFAAQFGKDSNEYKDVLNY